MLVLSRRTGERIVLPGCDVSIVVLQVSGNRVRLGVEAPPNTPVHRAEVWRRIRGELADPERALARPTCRCSP
jgi:carbon storage regulator